MSVNILQEDGLKKIAGNGITEADSELSETSENPIQNKAVTNALSEKADKESVENQMGLISQILENQFAIKNRRVIEDSEFDLNDCINPGLFESLLSKIAKNSPSFSCPYFYLIVIVYSEREGGFKFIGKQIAIGYTTEEVFSRHCFNDVWSDWKKISAV